MAINKNFVVKNGIDVADNLVYATSDLNKVGIGSTLPTTTLDVVGQGIKAADGRFTGILTANSSFDVGTSGTIFTVGSSGLIGINSSSPAYTLEIVKVGSADTAINVTGGITLTENLSVGGTVTATIADFSSTLRSVGVTTLASSGGITTTGGDLYVGGDFYVADSLKTVGVTTLASSGGITTTGGDLDVGGDLYVLDDIVYDEVVGRNIRITGIATLGTVQISSGIVTATSGVVTYYGDGSNLTGVATNLTATVGLGSEGTFIGAGATMIDFKSTTGANIAVDAATAGIATVTITPGASIGLVIALGG